MIFILNFRVSPDLRLDLNKIVIIHMYPNGIYICIGYHLKYLNGMLIGFILVQILNFSLDNQIKAHHYS